MQPIDAGLELDRQREPLKRLASALLGDAHAAEDVVQEAFATALARGERPTGLATWLRTVVRNLALDRKRRSARRDARERSAARHEAATDGDALERLELIEALAREVRSLDEPFRTAVRLRYFDGLRPNQIAAKLGVPLATVDSRLVRGLERLRERLDRRGGRERWLAALAAWIRPAKVPWMEIALMKTVTKLGVAAAVLLLAWWSWDAWSSGGGSGSSDASARASTATPENELVSTPTDAQARTVLAATAPTIETATPRTPQLAGIVVDPDGLSIAEVEIGFVADGESEPRSAPRAKSGSDGRFAIDDPSTSGALHALGETWFTLGAPAIGPLALPCDRVVCVVPRAPLAGIVVDREGAPLEGVLVSLAFRLESLRLPMPASDLAPFARYATSARDGSYRIDDAPLFDDGWLRATRAGSSARPGYSLRDVRADNGRIVFQYDRTYTRLLHARVVDEHEQPIAGAYIDVGPKGHHVAFPRGTFVQVRSDARGEFEFPVSAGSTDEVVTVAAVGRQSVSVEATGDAALDASWPSPFVIRLDRRALAIRGRVVDERGQPLTDAWVDLFDPTPWGTVPRTDDALEPWADYAWEELASGRKYFEHSAVGGDGRFEIGELAPRPYRLLVFDARTLHWSLSEPIEAGAQDVELMIDTSVRRERVAGRVIDSSGAPVAGARVRLGVTMPWRLEASGETAETSGMSSGVRTDERGRFEFLGVHPDAIYVAVDPPGTHWAGSYEFLSRAKDVCEMEIVLPRVAFVRVELSTNALPPEQVPTDVLAVDARGMSSNGGIAGLNSYPTFDGTRSTGVFPLGDTARFLIVRNYGDNVLRIPVELEAGKLNVIRR
ncbi:MAG: sigma-70 family RNA polymerase sigma factor [Planctomycetes bacterium]|nr:sigma-70 family RNA polymerase sigma factor [Planctomycetota bacterium]